MASRSWNKAELIGNLTRDPEIRYTPNGAAVCTFSIATNRSYVVDGERKEEADFHRIVAWNKLAELCGQLLKKGNRVFVSGRLQNRSWEGQDGMARQTTEIVIDDMIILTSRTASESTEEASETLPVEKEKVKPKEESKLSAKEENPKKPEEQEKKEKEESSEPVAPQENVNEDDLPF